MNTKEKSDMSYEECIKSLIKRSFIGKYYNKLDNRGFSLVELIVICAIVTILAMIAIPTYTDLRERAKISNAKSDIRVLEKAITAYLVDHSGLPDQLSDIGTEANILDPWKHNYQYYKLSLGSGIPYLDTAGSERLNSDFDLFSQGPDNDTDHDLSQSKSDDDIVRGGSGAEVELGRNYL